MESSPVPPKLAVRYAGEVGPEALHRLFRACFSHHGESTVPIAQSLISLYNVEYVQLDMVRLCRSISEEQFGDVLTVMRWYRDSTGRIDELWEIYGPAGYILPQELVRRFTSTDPEVLPRARW